MASNLTVDTLTKGATTLNTDEIVDTNSNQICKAWVNFNGTGTVAIRDSYNVSSITDNATGRYTMNYTTALANANYSVFGTCGYQSGISGNVGFTMYTDGGNYPTTTTAAFISRRRDINANTDVNYVTAVVFGD